MWGDVKFIGPKVTQQPKFYCQLFRVYGPDIMSESVVRQGTVGNKNERTKIHVEESSGKPSLFRDNLNCKKVQENTN